MLAIGINVGEKLTITDQATGEKVEIHFKKNEGKRIKIAVDASRRFKILRQGLEEETEEKETVEHGTQS